MLTKTHLGEVDYLRVFGLTTIVFIHSLNYYLSMPAGPFSHAVEGLAINLLRYGRFIFMFVTGLVFFYSYQERELNLRRFFKRRLKNLVVPYAIWTAIYLLIRHWADMLNWSGPAGFASIWWQNILDGNAFYHLYYILVTIQFYLFLPVLLLIFKPRRPRIWAGIILAWGLIFCIVYYYLLEVQGNWIIDLVAGSPWAGFTGWVLQYKDRLLFSYLTFYLLGGLAGIYLEDCRKWLIEHRSLIGAGLVCGLAVVCGQYLYSYLYLGQSWNLAVSVFKPGMYLYCIAVTAILYRLSLALERRGSLRSLTHLLSANSLGIYLLHPAVLYYLEKFYLSGHHIFPFHLGVVLDPIFAIAVSCLISLLLGSNKYTCFIIGEAGNLRLQQLSAKSFSILAPSNIICSTKK